MKHLKRSGVLSTACLLLSILLLIVQHRLAWVALSNALFLWTLLFTIIGGFLWVFSSGFFDTFQASMHTAFKRKKNQDHGGFMPLSAVGRNAYALWLLTAGWLLIASVFCLILA